MFCGAEEGILNFTEELTIYDDSVHIHQKVAERVLLIKYYFNIGFMYNMLYLEL